MRIHEWEVWYTYSTYLDAPLDDLDSLAQLLVREGVAQCSLHSNGRTYWLTEGGLQSGLTSIDVEPNLEKASFSLKTSDGGPVNIDGFSREAWHQAVQFRFGEIRTFGDDLNAVPSHVRLFLGNFELTCTDANLCVSCYPVLKLYESGAVILEFRVINPGSPIDCKDFVERFVRLSRKCFDQVEVPPDIARLATRTYYQYYNVLPIHLRIPLVKVLARNDALLAEETHREPRGDFEFDYVPLTKEQGSNETLSSISQTVFHLVTFVMSRPRTGLSYALLGQRHMVRVGNVWAGRPHVHLIRFDEQGKTSEENEKVFRNEFGWILAGAWDGCKQLGAQYLPKNLRRFDDFGIYITSAGSLFAWAQKGYAQNKKNSAINHGPMVYQHQATAEMLEYGYILHRKLLDQSNSCFGSEEMIRTRRELAQLRQHMTSASHFGEVLDLLQAGWIAMGVQDLQQHISEALAIGESESTLIETRTSERINRLLAVIFGLIAVPQVTNDLVAPIWTYLHLWIPKNPSLAKLLMTGVAVSAVAAMIPALTYVIRHTGSRLRLAVKARR